MVRDPARLLAAIVISLQLVTASAGLAQSRAERAITQISGDLYRFPNNFHYSVFLVTPDSIIPTDPVNKEAARWLKGELTRRFAQPVKFLIFSNDHADHISGGEVFADTAVVVAHEKAKEAIVRKNYSDNSIVMRFPTQKTLFAVDFIPVKSLPYRDLSDSYIDPWIESLKRVEALDFETLVPGHGPKGGKADVRAFRGYMEELWGQVVAYARQGKSEAEIKRAITMENTGNGAGTKIIYPSISKACYDRSLGITDNIGVLPS